MPGIVTGSPVVTELMVLFGCGAAVAAIGRVAYRGPDVETAPCAQRRRQRPRY